MKDEVLAKYNELSKDIRESQEQIDKALRIIEMIDNNKSKPMYIEISRQRGTTAVGMQTDSLDNGEEILKSILVTMRNRIVAYERRQRLALEDIVKLNSVVQAGNNEPEPSGVVSIENV